ncbi:MAG: hypothetical protein H0W71_04220 [Sphingomonas sp.]|nr:hypothetical protein [Sphingomonas sp.]
MKVVSKILVGGAAISALISVAPAAAQSYPGYGYPNSGGNVVGQVLNQVLGGGTYSGYGYNGYTNNTQVAVQQCAAAVEQRLTGGYGNAYGGNGGYNNGYGGNGGYNNGYGGNGAYGGHNGGHDAYGRHTGGGRVIGITHADRHSEGRVKVKGVASSGMNAGYGGYGYAQQAGDLKFSCEVDHHGNISDLHINPINNGYGYRRY